MNIVYSSDENYVQHLGVSLYSLLYNNTMQKEINIFIIENKIMDESKKKIVEIVLKFERKITWINFENYMRDSFPYIESDMSMSAFARLFLTDMLPSWCNKVIYLDCDTIVADSIEEFWRYDIENNAVAGVIDFVSPELKERIGLLENSVYINSGVLLINLEQWRNRRLKEQCIDFINKYGGNVCHNDQGVINGVLSSEIKLIEPKYNAMTPFFTTNYNNIKYIYKLKEYYTKKVVKEAIKCYKILHFTPEFVGRVWEKNCRHPLKKIYLQYLDYTPWKKNIVNGVRISFKKRCWLCMLKYLPTSVLKKIM